MGTSVCLWYLRIVTSSCVDIWGRLCNMFCQYAVCYLSIYYLCLLYITQFFSGDNIGCRVCGYKAWEAGEVTKS